MDMSPPKNEKFPLVNKPNSSHHEKVGDIWKELYVVHWPSQGMRDGKFWVLQSQ